MARIGSLNRCTDQKQHFLCHDLTSALVGASQKHYCESKVKKVHKLWIWVSRLTIRCVYFILASQRSLVCQLKHNESNFPLSLSVLLMSWHRRNCVERAAKTQGASVAHVERCVHNQTACMHMLPLAFVQTANRNWLRGNRRDGRRKQREHCLHLPGDFPSWQMKQLQNGVRIHHFLTFVVANVLFLCWSSNSCVWINSDHMRKQIHETH